MRINLRVLTAASTLALAQGFTTGAGSPLLTIQSISIGAYASSPGGPRTVSIYSNVGNKPGSPLFTSSATTVTGQSTYAFNFSGANLFAGTSYWVVPDFSTDWSWYLNADQTQPDQLNASGYAYLGTVRQQQSSPGTWSNCSQPYSLSIVATTGVPELDPSSLGSVVALLGGVLGLLERRRLKAA